VPHFSRRYPVLRIDQRGFGRSDALPADCALTTERYVEDLVEVIRRLARAPVHVVAVKSGGISAMVLAATHPDLARTITVACSPVTPPAAEGWLEEMERDGMRAWAKRTQRSRMGAPW
jgi:pimeloyl-ACP methyl ester carboxylesterase